MRSIDRPSRDQGRWAGRRSAGHKSEVTAKRRREYSSDINANIFPVSLAPSWSHLSPLPTSTCRRNIPRAHMTTRLTRALLAQPQLNSPLDIIISCMYSFMLPTRPYDLLPKSRFVLGVAFSTLCYTSPIRWISSTAVLGYYYKQYITPCCS